MRLPAKGLPKDEVFRRLEAARGRDLPWREGGTFAYVYVAGEEVEDLLVKAFSSYLTENALDPTVYPSLLKFEQDIVGIAATHLSGDEEVVGNFTTGGTESILLAVKSARDRARDLFPHITRPELVLPVTAHAAFHKACAYFDVTPVLVPMERPSYRVDPAKMAAAITDQTIMLVASAPGYAHGVIDPVEHIARLAAERNLLCHVDACVGGWMLPFWRRCGAPIPAFDFSVPGVTSISMDFHKYAYAAKPASILLWRNKELRKYQIFAGANWTGYSVVNPTILSTKCGGPYAACWALLHYMGEEGYLRFAQRMIDGARRIIEGLREIPGVRILGEPDFSMVAFTTDGFSVFPVADLMRERKWFIQPQLGFNGSEPNIHLSIDQSTIDIVEPFLKDLRDCIETARGMAVNAPPELKAALEQIDPERLDRQTFLALMDQAGMAGDDLPEGGTAGVNEILNSAPPALTGAILKAYMNELYVQPKRTPEEAA